MSGKTAIATALVALSGECLRGVRLVWLNGAVVRSQATCLRFHLFVSECNGRPHYRCSIIGSCQSTATSDDCKARLVRFLCKT